MVSPINPSPVYSMPISQEQQTLERLENLLQAWVNNPLAAGNKEEAKRLILEAFTNKSSRLTLHELNLTLLPEGVFNFFPSLTHLDLSKNELISFTLSTGSFPSLTYLDLSTNQLTSFTLPEDSLPFLIHLHLSNNQLTSFTLSTGSLPSLTYLDLSTNQLTSFTPPEDSLPLLTLLNLSRNKLTSFTLSRGPLPLLTALGLSTNQLTSFTPLQSSLPLSHSARALLQPKFKFDPNTFRNDKESYPH